MDIMEDFRILLESSDDLYIITVKVEDKAHKQKCEDYIKDQNTEEDICTSFELCGDDINYGTFYIDNLQIDLLGLEYLLEILRKITNLLNKNNIGWEGRKFKFETGKWSKDRFLRLGPGFGIVTKSKFILIFSDEENNIIKHEFSLMDKL